MIEEPVEQAASIALARLGFAITDRDIAGAASARSRPTANVSSLASYVT